MTEPGTPHSARVAYLDCSLGVAGDMLLGALVDAGADPATVSRAVADLNLSVRFESARRAGFACTRALVDIPPAPDRERRLPDVFADIMSSGLSGRAREYALRVFRLLAEAEATVHGCSPDDVHFHEIGAQDALCDVLGCAAALDSLGLLSPDARVYVSGLAAGSGIVAAAHGHLPVPVPAVVELARRTGASLLHGGPTGERTTPTGAALVLSLAETGPPPVMTVTKVGSGGGRRDDADYPNITRVLIGRRSTDRPNPPGQVIVIESLVDDLDPRLWQPALSAIRAAGAWDCWTTPIIGRGGRPGQSVTALCSEQVRDAVIEAVIRHTGTLGVRWSEWQRRTIPRRSVSVRVSQDGETEALVSVKLGILNGELVVAQPEFAELCQAAETLGRPLREVLTDVLTTWRSSASSDDGGRAE